MLLKLLWQYTGDISEVLTVEQVIHWLFTLLIIVMFLQLPNIVELCIIKLNTRLTSLPSNRIKMATGALNSSKL